MQYLAVFQSEIIQISPEDLEFFERDRKCRVIPDIQLFQGIDVSEEPRMCYQYSKRVQSGKQSVDLNIAGQLICLFDETMNFFYPILTDSPNHDLQEYKLSLRIAKNNVSIDPGNKYYQSVLENLRKKGGDNII